MHDINLYMHEKIYLDIFFIFPHGYKRVSEGGASSVADVFQAAQRTL